MIKILKALHLLTIVVTAILVPIVLAHAVLQEKWHLLSPKQLGVLHQILLFAFVGLFVLPIIKDAVRKHEGNP